MTPKDSNPKSEHIDIKRSPVALSLKIKFFIITYVLLALITLLILLIPFDFLDYNFTLWGVIITCVVIVLFLLSLWYVKLAWKNTRYALTEQGLTVCEGVGFFKEEVFRVESIISVRIKQGYLGNYFGYGDIIIDIPKLQGEPDVILHDVDQPGIILQIFREKLRKTSKNAGVGTALIM